MSKDIDQVVIEKKKYQDQLSNPKSESNQLVPESLQSHAMIQDLTDDDKKYRNTDEAQKDNQVFNFLSRSSQEEEKNNKISFFASEVFNQFSEILVISLIRRDYSNYEPFPQLSLTIIDAIVKAIRDSIENSKKVDIKHFKQDEKQYFHYFTSDISVGFVSSTGQLKSTGFIWVQNSLIDHFINLKDDLFFNESQTKISLFFHPINYQKSQMMSPKSATLPGPQLGIFEDRKECQSSVLQSQSAINKYTMEYPGIKSSQAIYVPSLIENDNEINIRKLPLCHTNNWVKQAFIQNDRFKKQYILLKKLDEQMKNGVNMYYVYRPLDDQIYAVKKSKLNSLVLTFYDVFSSVNLLQEVTNDQRKIREAKILSKLNHPNILRLYDWWIEEEKCGYSLFMQLEYCSFPGYKHAPNDLLHYAYYYMNPMDNKNKFLTIKNIMSQIIDALEFIHKRSIVHRDLKPENICVTINTHGKLQIMLADFDQGKDVRECKLSILAGEKIPELELNSIKSMNTIQSGTSGYQTPNSYKDRAYDQSDEFYALGITLLHLILTFPGEPKNRNVYAHTFIMSEIDMILQLFDVWANKKVPNKNKEFNFKCFVPQLLLAKNLLDKTCTTHEQIREVLRQW